MPQAAISRDPGQETYFVAVTPTTPTSATVEEVHVEFIADFIED